MAYQTVGVDNTAYYESLSLEELKEECEKIGIVTRNGTENSLKQKLLKADRDAAAAKAEADRKEERDRETERLKDEKDRETARRKDEKDRETARLKLEKDSEI